MGNVKHQQGSPTRATEHASPLPRKACRHDSFLGTVRKGRGRGETRLPDDSVSSRYLTCWGLCLGRQAAPNARGHQLPRDQRSNSEASDFHRTGTGKGVTGEGVTGEGVTREE